MKISRMASLRDHVVYNKDTGMFMWKEDKRNVFKPLTISIPKKREVK